MATKENKECKKCGVTFGVGELSSKGHCYNCAKKKMIEAFDTMWNLSPKRGGPGLAGRQ